MSAAIPWGADELQTLVTNPASRIFLVQKKIPVVLQPFHLQDLKSAVRDLLNASIDRYHKLLEGILLSYKHLKVLSKCASVSAETSGVVIDIQADFYVFRPEVNCILKGVVNKISKEHVGVLVYHRFNISCLRPSSDARSEKWLGNHVRINQEVTFKIKETNFTGRLPFFKGKLLSIGNVLTEMAEEKKSKKKKMDAPDSSEVVAALETSTNKKRKHKLEESEEKAISKSKKIKKESKTSDIPQSLQVCNSTAEPISTDVSSTQKKQKKKRVSIGVIPDSTDYIPSLPLDFSQLPEDLPPPNADSTHFDLAKNLSSLSSKSEKKKKKDTGTVLSAIREESSDVLKNVQNTQTLSESIIKDQLSGEQKVKKKKEKRDKSIASSLHPEVEVQKLDLQTSASKISRVLPSTSTVGVETSSSNPAETCHKKKHKSQKKESSLDNSYPMPSNFVNLQDTLMKKRKASETESNVTDTLPIKEKKSKKEPKNLNVSLHSNIVEELKKPKGKDNILPPDSKNKLKESKSSLKDSKIDEIAMNMSPSKQSKKKKKEENLNVSFDDALSDDFIPPGQSILVRDFPVKKPTTPLNLASPPQTPTKSSLTKQITQKDSPKKVVISSMRRRLSDSDDDDNNVNLQHNSRKSKEDSDDSDSESAVKNQILQSMGVMQSPLKSAVYSSKQDASDSESDESIPETKQKAPVPKLNPLKSSIAKTKTLVNTEVSPKKPVPQLTKAEAAKSSAQDSDSDSDLEAIRSTLAALQEERRKGLLSPTEKSKKSTPLVDAKGATNSKTEKTVVKTKSSKNSKTTSVGIVPDTNGLEANPSMMPTLKSSNINSDLKTTQPAPPTSKDGSVTSKSKKKKDTKKTAVNISEQNTKVTSPVQEKNLLLSTSMTSPMKKKSVSLYSSDSDSGPDDRNTTDLMEQMRLKRAAEVPVNKKTKKSLQTETKDLSETAPALKAKKQKKSADAKKGPMDGLKLSESVPNVKPKKSDVKGNKDTKKSKTSKKETKATVESSDKNSKTKGKVKPNTDDLISDVMKRLLEKAKLDVGLA